MADNSASRLSGGSTQWITLYRTACRSLSWTTDVGFLSERLNAAARTVGS